MCPVQPLRIPGNTNINCFFFSWNASEDGYSEHDWSLAKVTCWGVVIAVTYYHRPANVAYKSQLSGKRFSFNSWTCDIWRQFINALPPTFL